MQKHVFWNGRVLALVLAAALMAAPEVLAQGARTSTANRQLSQELWNLWRKGFELFEKGEMKMISGRYEESIPLYQQSLDAFNQVRKRNPDWNRSVIDYRISLSTRRIASAKRKAKEAVESAKRMEQRKKYEAEAKAIREKDEKYRAVSVENEKLKKQLEALQGELKSVRYSAERGNAAIRQIKGLLSERDVLEKKLALLNLQYTELLEKHKKVSISAETEKLLTTEQAKTAAFMKLVKEQNEELANIRKQYGELTAEKEKRDKMLEDVSRTLSNEKTFAEVERKKLQDDLAAANSRLRETEKRLSTSARELAEKTRAAEEAAEQIRRLKAEQSVAAASRRIEAEAAAVRKDNETLKKAVAAAITEKTDANEKLAAALAESARLKKDLVSNIEQRNSFAKTNDTLSKRLAELEKTSRRLADENAAVRKDLVKVTADRDLFARKVNERFNEMSDKRISELKLQLAELRKAGESKTNELTNSLSAKDAELARLRKQLSEAESAGKAQLAELRKAGESKTNELTNSLSAKDAELARLRKQLSEAESAGKAQLAELRKAGESKTNELTNSLSAKDAELARLRKQLSEAESAGKAQAREMETLKLSLDSMKKASSESKGLDKARLESAIAALTGKLTVTEQSLKEANSSRADLEKRLKSLQENSAEAAAALRDNADLKARVTNLSGKLASAEQSKTALEAVRKSLETEVASLKGKLADRAAQPAPSPDAAKAELTKLTASLIELREANAQYENAVRNLTASGKKLQAEKESLAKELAEAKKVLASRDAAPNNSLIARENLELKEKAVRSEKLYAELKAERDELAARRIALDKEVVRLRQDNEALTKSETLLKADLKRWSEGAGGTASDAIAKKNQAIDELIRELEAGKNTKKQLELQITDLRNEVSRLKNRSDKAVETAKKAVDDARRYRRELTTLRADIEDGMIASKSSSAPQASVTVTEAKTPEKTAPAPVKKQSYDEKAYLEAMANARAAEAKKDLGTALWQYWRAADIAVERPEPYLNLVRIHLLRKEKDSAEKAYRKALQNGAERDMSLEDQFK